MPGDCLIYDCDKSADVWISSMKRFWIVLCREHADEKQEKYDGELFERDIEGGG